MAADLWVLLPTSDFIVDYCLMMAGGKSKPAQGRRHSGQNGKHCLASLRL